MSVLTRSGNILPEMGLPISKAADAWIGLSTTAKLHIAGGRGGGGRSRGKTESEKDDTANERKIQKYFPFKTSNSSVQKEHAAISTVLDG